MSDPICYSRKFFMQFFEGDQLAATVFLYKHPHWENIRGVGESKYDSFTIGIKPPPGAKSLAAYHASMGHSYQIIEDNKKVMPSMVFLVFADGRHKSLDRPHSFYVRYTDENGKSSMIPYNLVDGEYKPTRILDILEVTTFVIPNRIVI